MWCGRKDKGKERLVCQRVLPNNKIGGFTPLDSKHLTGFTSLDSKHLTGFTLVELIVISFILGIIISALAAVLNITNLSNAIGMTKAITQTEARNVMNWISKDTRQTSGYQITNNEPSSDHIKFQLCTGYNGTAAALEWNSTFIEYTFDASSNTLTRSNTGTGQTWQFYNVTASPFNTTRLDENILGITIFIQKTARGLIQPAVNLTREVKLRNG